MRNKQHHLKNRQTSNLPSYLHIHLQTFFASLGRLSRTPFNFMMTIGVIGITLSLPAGMMVAIDNFKAVSGTISLNHNMSVFLKVSATKDDANKLLAQLTENPKVSSTTLIDKQAALDEFKQYSGFNAALNLVEKNPLPHVIQLTPHTDFTNTRALEILLAEINQNPLVDNAQLDMTWMKRLNALLSIAQRSITLITLLLGIAVLLIVSNTIRLELQNRREEIEITRLVGATQAFIRRPFIYSGFWYGLFGGILACLLVQLSLWILDGPTSTLSNLYGSGFDLHYLSFSNMLNWLVFSVLLGITGSWIVVSQHLSTLENLD